MTLTEFDAHYKALGEKRLGILKTMLAPTARPNRFSFSGVTVLGDVGIGGVFHYSTPLDLSASVAHWYLFGSRDFFISDLWVAMGELWDCEIFVTLDWLPLEVFARKTPQHIKQWVDAYYNQDRCLTG